MAEFVPTEYETDEAFVASVAKMTTEYSKLSDAKLAKKIRHLRRAVSRCSLQRNADLIVAFHEAAMSIAKTRVAAQTPNAMHDIAEILARPAVIGALRSLVRGAMIDGGVSDPHATRIAISFADRVREGAPVVTAVNLVDEIQKAFVEALGWDGCLTGDCPHDKQSQCDTHIADQVRRITAS